MSLSRSIFEIPELTDDLQSWLLPSAREMGQLEEATIGRGTSASVLMERAGLAIAERIWRLFSTQKRFVVLCGPGNNGGDGLVIGRLLRERGAHVDIVLSSSERYSEECAAQARMIRDLLCFGGACVLTEPHVRSISKSDLHTLLSGSDVIIDALLGTGQQSAPRGAIRGILEVLRAIKADRSQLSVVAVDVPTGLDTDTGGVFEPIVPADFTFTVQFVKRGMLQFPARSLCGAIVAVSIGIEPADTVEYSLVHKVSLPPVRSREPDIHKGMLGRILVIGGSVAMPGAPFLASLGALRAGAGIVSRVVRRSWQTIPPLAEAMYEVLAGAEDYFTARDAEVVLNILKRYDVVVLGPGLGTNPATGEFVSALLSGLKGAGVALVIDADALNFLSLQAAGLDGQRVVLTPHPGEAGRLLSISAVQVQRDRFTAARRLSDRYGAVVALKGAGTLIHNGLMGRLVAEGTPFLATPGSGDVLAGVIGACIPRSKNVYDAASYGVWRHAKAGVRASQKSGGTILASDIAAALC